MKKHHARIIALGAVCGMNLFCQGQTSTPAHGPNASPPLTISGTIYDPSGAPAPGVVLQLGPPKKAEIKSDESGKYTLTWKPRPGLPGGYQASPLIARDMGHNFAVAHAVDEATTKLDLHLQPGLTVSAAVKDTDGKPITNATGTVGLYLGSREIPGVAGSSSLFERIGQEHFRADNQGRIRFSALPQGWRYDVFFEADGYGSSLGQTIQAADTHTSSLNLPAVILKSANLMLAGLVVGADGEPAAQARVYITGPMQRTTNLVADARGHFAVKVCEGAVNIQASRTGFTGVKQTVGGDTDVVIRLIKQE